MFIKWCLLLWQTSQRGQSSRRRVTAGSIHGRGCFSMDSGSAACKSDSKFHPWHRKIQAKSGLRHPVVKKHAPVQQYMKINGITDNVNDMENTDWYWANQSKIIVDIIPTTPDPHLYASSSCPPVSWGLQMKCRKWRDELFLWKRVWQWDSLCVCLCGVSDSPEGGP